MINVLHNVHFDISLQF